MSALFYMHTRSLKNRFLAALRDPRLIAKALGLTVFIAIIIVGALTGVQIRGENTDMLVLKGMMFLVFLLPYWAGRFGGGGTFGVEDVNHIFTAPIPPRTVLLSGLIRQLGGMLVICVAVMVVFSFASTVMVISLAHILWAGLFGLILMVVCKLMGMYLFVAYKKIYRWIGLLWMLMLAGVFVFHTSRAGWDWTSGLLAVLDSHVFALTPFVGWAAAGAFGFGVGQVLHGVIYTGLLVASGVYFFWAIYRSNPDFALDEGGEGETSGQSTTKPQDTARHAFPNKTGPRMFFHKHVLEASRVSRLGIFGLDIIGIIGWTVFAVVWGLYARSLYIDIEIVSLLFIYVGVPSRSILALLMPLVFVVAIYPYFDRGFREYSSPYFYLMPASPGQKLFWISMLRAVNVCVTAVLVLGIGGAISGTSPLLVIIAMLAYVSAAFMALGVRAAAVGLFGAMSKAGKTLAATLPVLLFVLLGWIGMLAVFYSGNESWVEPVALLGLAGWCLAVGGAGFWYGVRVLHDLDAVG